MTENPPQLNDKPLVTQKPSSGKHKKVVKKKKRVPKKEEPEPIPQPVADPEPENFLEFQIGPKLGRGAFGSVYQGLNINTGEYVAIKTISLLRFADAMNSVQSEIDLMEPLEHPNVVKYVTSYKTQTFLYIVMEFAEGGSLQNVQKKFENFSEHLLAQYLYQVLLGLKYLHEQSIIHRDIKAANILLSKGVAKLSDFGISVKLTDKKNSDADFACSPYWAAPEVISMEPITEKCDIWSLGITAIEMYQGKPPYFDLNPMRAMFQIVQNPEPPLPENITPDFKDFLQACLTKNVNFRRSTEQLLDHPFIQRNINPQNFPTHKDEKLMRFQEDSNLTAFETSLVSSTQALNNNVNLSQSSFIPPDEMENNPQKSNIRPAGLDGFREDSDGDDMFGGDGIMEHVERTGIHSGDSISVYPPQHLSPSVIRTLVDYTGRFARELKVVGLVNVQYAVQNGKVYVIEVNPRSSRTVPYISKVTGIPMVELAVRCTLGQKLKDMGYGTGLFPDAPYVAVKVPVFSFEKLHGVDTMLGPEMKSTGEVLGIAPTYKEALLKGLVAAGYQFKKPGPGSCVILTVKDSDKPEILDLAWKLKDYGYKLYGTEGTCRFLNKHMVACNMVRQMSGDRPNVVDLLESGLVDYIISTSAKGRDPSRDSVKFRRKACELSIPTLTALDTANVLVNALRGDHDISTIPLVDIADLAKENARRRLAKG